ncbi:uncharacterized protein LOC132944338 [Metopolophium dirhodum]|uniref:uncharacterized protein LOC132944338 n=1 Tax=Metopolophium dirhodum TaxID=44670 RepID=UPI00298FC653|nr:uncharacterized protein LOC132944338 [Metopolophium dirhodum]
MRQNKDTRPIVNLDETWVNQNYSRSIAWQHDSMVGPKIPTGKCGRLIVVHAGCAKYGFIQNSKLIFRSYTGNSTDYHIQMNSEVFKSWFTQMLNSLEEPSVIVMDNASYHSTLIDNFPKKNLAELRQKVKALIPFEKKNELDVLSLEMGHEVIRLPPYHCQYNPIELIWAQCVRHAEALYDQDNEKEIMRDSMLEPIILTLLPDDSDWRESSDDEGNSE